MRRTFLAGSVPVAALAVAGLLVGLVSAAGATTRFAQGPHVRPITGVSRGCGGQNAEVEQAIDPANGYVYEEWMGCHNRIGFARSTDGGLRFSKPIVLPRSTGAWDPAVTVAPDGTVYAAFMNATKHHTFPVVEASFDHGRTFPQVTALVAGKRNNWGDRDFIAVAPDGSVYLTWDYGPSAKAVTYLCAKGGSCAFATGDLNAVIQKSADGGKTWGPIVHVSPGFPASGGDSAPLVIEHDGRIDVMYQGYHITSKTKYTMTPAHSYFTSSSDGGKTWSAPVRIGPAKLTMSLAEWWIDGDIGIDSAGNLYATWDTQTAGRDIGWLSYSTNHGRSWSALHRVTPDADNATHIVEVAGGQPGIAYVGWLADNSARGYAQYLRAFSISRGWLSAPVRVSVKFGNRAVWPGDTFGISTFPRGPDASLGGVPGGPQRVILSWGSAVSKQKKPDSEIFAAALRY
jgi:hypothetical protein